MNTFHRRYIFVDYDNLKEVKFKKLQKVCDKVFIFISSEEDQIPFDLVIHLQKMGKSAVKWIVVDPTEEGNMNYVMSFMMGRLHQKVDRAIEFAVLSNDSEFDTIVSFMNNSNRRSCVRVKRDNLEAKKNETQPSPKPRTEKAEYTRVIKTSTASNGNYPPTKYVSFSPEEKEAIEQSAENTINKLMRSGNRPSNLALLRDYIMTTNHGIIFNNNSVDKVINRLRDAHEIEVSNNEVIYNF